MLLRQLEYFVAVARERHFARAAESCYVSQPALSTSIAKLERELSVTLINRGQNFEGLTPEGERLVVWAKRILAEQEAFKAEAAAVQSGITGTLRLGTEPTASTTQALPVAAFCAAHPPPFTPKTIMETDGTYRVGTDIVPGTYRSAGTSPEGATDC